MSEEKRLRARQFTYVQDLEHMKLKLDDINELDSVLLGSGCSEFAWILHDKDTDKETGETIRPHIHVDLKFDNPRDLSSISDLFKDEEQYVELIKGKYGWENSLAYLCHRTANSKEKYQ